MSPTATQNDVEAVAAVERATDELFYDRGVVAVSMAQIRDSSGVSLRRLYSLYPSKADVISAWLRYRHRTWMEGFAQAVDANLDSGEEPVDAIFSALAAWMIRTRFRGCGFINTRAELSELTAEHTQIIQDHKQSLAGYLGTLSPQGDTLALLVDGAIVQASIFATVEPIELAHRAAGRITHENAT